MDEFLQRFIGDTMVRIEGFRRDGKMEDVSTFAQSLERTALFLGATGIAAAAQGLRDAVAQTTGRDDRNHAAIADVRAKLEDVARELRAFSGDRHELPSASAGATTPLPAIDAPSGSDDNSRTIGLALDAIRIGERLRRLDQAKVDMLESSMRDIGLRTPITVAADAANGWRLVAGLHRLEAARRLGQPEITCFVLDRSAPAARLWEIDENLVRSELTQLERDQHLLRRKQIFDEWMIGKTGRNPPSLGGRSNKGFATDTEEKTGIAKRRVNESVHRATRIADEVQHAVRQMPAAGIRVELDALAGLDPEQQKLAVGKVERGEAVNFRAARRQIRGDRESEETQRHFKELRSAWRNAGAEARTRFLRWLRKTAEAEVLGVLQRSGKHPPDRPCEGRESVAPDIPARRRRLNITYVGTGDDGTTRNVT